MPFVQTSVVDSDGSITTAQASSQTYIDLSQSPVQFSTGIRADLAGTNQILTVFYTS